MEWAKKPLIKEGQGILEKFKLLKQSVFSYDDSNLMLQLHPEWGEVPE